MKLVPLGSVAEVIAGQSPEGKYYNSSGHGVPFYQGKKEFGDKFLGAPTTWTTKTTKLSRPRDILMSVRAPVGPINFATEEICIGRGLAAIRAGKDLDKEFLFYFLLHKQPDISGNAGAVFDSINKDQIGSIPIPLLSLEKQREIVEKLENAFAEIESLSERSNSMLLSANQMLSSLIASWITGLSTGMSAKLGELAELKGRIGWRGLTAKEYTETGPLFLSVHSLNHGHYVDFARAFHISQDRYDESPEIQIQEGYILIAKDGAGLGKVAMVGEVKEPTTVNSSLLVVKPNAQVRTKYLYCYFLSDAFKALIASRLGGSTVPHLYQRDIAQIPVALLEPDQQDEFIVRFDTAAELLDKLISNLEKRAKLILELKNSVLSHTFALVN